MESQALLLEDIIIDSLFEFDWRKTHKPTIVVWATNIQLMTAREVCVCGVCVACTSPLRVQYFSDWIRERVRQGLCGQGSVWCSNEVPRLQVAPATPVSQLQHAHTHTRPLDFIQLCLNQSAESLRRAQGDVSSQCFLKVWTELHTHAVKQIPRRTHTRRDTRHAHTQSDPNTHTDGWTELKV